MCNEDNVTIQFTSELSIQNMSSYDEILEQLIKLKKDGHINIEFNNLELDKNNLPLFLSLIALIQMKTIMRINLKSYTAKSYGYLDDIDYFKLRNSRRPLIEYKQRICKHDVLIPFTYVEKFDVLTDARLKLIQRLPAYQNIPHELRSTISSIVGEVGENVSDHAFETDELIFYVYVETNAESVWMVLLDRGMGFYSNLSNAYGNEIKDSEDALKKAILQNYSEKKTESRRSGGMGYKTITQAVDKYSGCLIVTSGDCTLRYNNSKDYKTFRHQYSVTGSDIFVELKIR